MLNNDSGSCATFSCQGAGGATAGSPRAAPGGCRKKRGYNDNGLLPLFTVHNVCQVTPSTPVLLSIACVVVSATTVSGHPAERIRTLRVHMIVPFVPNGDPGGNKVPVRAGTKCPQCASCRST
jgi:hypothetical protein